MENTLRIRQFTKNNYKLGFGLVYILLVMLLGIYSTFGYYLFQSFYTPVPIGHQIAITLLFLIQFVGIFIYSIKVAKKKIVNIPLIIISIALFALQIMVFCLSEDFFSLMINDYRGNPALVVGELDAAKRAYYLIRAFNFLFLLYFLIIIIPAYFNNRYRGAFVAIMAIIVLFCAIIFSLACEMESCYIPFITHFFDKQRDYSPKSFFMNMNNFGLALFMGIICALYLHNVYHKWWILLFAAFFFLYQIFPLSKTSIILSTLFILAYAFYRFLYTFKKHKVRNLITCFAFIIIVVSLGLAIGLTSAKDFVYQHFLIDGSGTLSTRMNTWAAVGQINARNPFFIIFGSGYGYISDLLTTCTPGITAHNQFVQELANAGIPGVYAVIGLIIYAYYSFIRRINKDKEFYIFMTLFLSIMIPYFFFEAVI